MQGSNPEPLMSALSQKRSKADTVEWPCSEMKTICDEFEAYGYRRVDAELRHRGIVVNTKKIRRLMREHALNRKQHRRFIATTDSDHDYPIFPDLAKTMTPDGPNQLWVADITYVAITTGFVYLAAILDAWSRRVVGYAISRSIDARLAVAALKAAISARDPPRGCVHHSDRGSQYASEDYRMVLREHGLEAPCTPARRLHGADESRLALHGASRGGAAMIASKSDHICGEIGAGGLDYPRRRLARRPPSAIGLGPHADAYGHAILAVPTS